MTKLFVEQVRALDEVSNAADATVALQQTVRNMQHAEMANKKNGDDIYQHSCLVSLQEKCANNAFAKNTGNKYKKTKRAANKHEIEPMQSNTNSSITMPSSNDSLMQALAKKPISSFQFENFDSLDGIGIVINNSN